MTTPIPVSSGEKQAALQFQRQAYEWIMLMLGTATKTIYLNGGSESRRETTEYWREIAKEYNIRFRAYGWCVILGGSDAS